MYLMYINSYFNCVSNLLLDQGDALWEKMDLIMKHY